MTCCLQIRYMHAVPDSCLNSSRQNFTDLKSLSFLLNFYDKTMPSVIIIPERLSIQSWYIIMRKKIPRGMGSVENIHRSVFLKPAWIKYGAVSQPGHAF